MQSSVKATMGILIGNAETPGLAPCIQQLVARANLIGMQVCWIRDGWDALLALSPNDAEISPPSFISLNPARAKKLHLGRPHPAERVGGSQKRPDGHPSIHFKPKSNKAASKRVKQILAKHGIELLVSIGGDRTLSLALQMSQAGVPVVAIPKPWSSEQRQG